MYMCGRPGPLTVNSVQFATYRIYSRNLRTFFSSSLAAEKSRCVKYADFPAFGPRNALLSLFEFF
jgi:hypothetical protein